MHYICRYFRFIYYSNKTNSLFIKKEEIRGINLKSEDGTYGTADWVSNEEVNKILGKNDVAGIILGKKKITL